MSRVDDCFAYLGLFDYESQVFRDDELDSNREIPDEVSLVRKEILCGDCYRPKTRECFERGHFSTAEVRRFYLSHEWRVAVLSGIAAELGSTSISQHGSVFMNNSIRLGFFLKIGDYYEQDMEHAYANLVGAEECDAVVTIAKRKVDRIREIENQYPELLFVEFRDFEQRSFRERIYAYARALGHQNQTLKRHNASGSDMRITSEHGTYEPLSPIRREVRELVDSIILQGRSSLGAGNMLETLLKRLCNLMFFQYSISDRRNLPDMLLFQPGALQYFLVDVKSGKFGSSQQRQVMDYSSDHLYLSLPGRVTFIAGMMIIHWNGVKRDVESFCRKAEEKLRRIRGMNDRFKVVWLTIDGLLFLSEWVDKEVNARFLLNYFLSEILCSGFNDPESLARNLSRLREEIGTEPSDRDIIQRALSQNVNRFHPKGSMVRWQTEGEDI